jgi:drug/metabolite transporter (DMT)-like permease
MLLFFVKKEELKKLLPYWPVVLIYSITKMAFTFITFNLGLSRVSPSMGAMIVGSSPAIAIILAVIFIPNEHLNKRKFAAMSLGMIAIVMLSLRKSSDGSSQLLGVVLLLSNVIASSITDIFIKRKSAIKFSVTLNFVAILIGAIIVFFVGSVTEEFSFVTFSGNYQLIGGLIFLAFITACATTLWLKLIQSPNVEVSEISIWKLLIPSAGALLSWIFTPGDNATSFSIFALSLILVSIFIATRKTRKKKVLA